MNRKHEQVNRAIPNLSSSQIWQYPVYLEAAVLSDAVFVAEPICSRFDRLPT